MAHTIEVANHVSDNTLAELKTTVNVLRKIQSAVKAQMEAAEEIGLLPDPELQDLNWKIHQLVRSIVIGDQDVFAEAVLPNS